jgi:predicted DNA-binding transcriptional regulator AlpA
MESIRAARYRAQRAAERLHERLTADADARATLDAWHRDWLDRRRAAARLGIAERTLKAWQLAGKGPRPVKFGTHRQSRVAWRAADIDAYLTNPVAYESEKSPASPGVPGALPSGTFAVWK